MALTEKFVQDFDAPGQLAAQIIGIEISNGSSFATWCG